MHVRVQEQTRTSLHRCSRFKLLAMIACYNNNRRPDEVSVCVADPSGEASALSVAARYFHLVRVL